MVLNKFVTDDSAMSSVTIVALLLVVTLIIAIILAVFILGLSG
ncbi:MAG: hypothetical protein ABEH86_06030 [Haloarcula sp.]